jgi:hypothetical protein
MLTLADVAASLVSLSKNLISDQTPTGLTYASGSPAFDATYGLGIATSSSIVVAAHAGGFNDQRVTGVMRWRAPTSSPNEEFGVIARFQTFEVAGSQNYYYARVDGGVAKLTKVVAGSFTNLATVAFALSADVDVTIVLSCVGNAISASFTASGLGTQSLSATDSAITTGGLMGFRTLSTAGYCSSLLAEQL